MTIDGITITITRFDDCGHTGLAINGSCRGRRFCVARDLRDEQKRWALQDITTGWRGPIVRHLTDEESSALTAMIRNN